MTNLIVLGIFSHPDDELAAAGTFANHSDAGDEVHLLYLTQGEGTSKLNGSKKEIKTKRRNQAAAASQILGATPHFLDFGDKYVRSDRKHADQIATEIKRIKPDIIITWNQPLRTGTGHPDHRNTHSLVLDATTYARFNEGEDLEPHRERISLYTIQHHESNPQDLVHVDVSHQYDRIMEFVDEYIETFGEWDVRKHKTTMLQYFGEFVRCEYAEAFKKLTWRKARTTLD